MKDRITIQLVDNGYVINLNEYSMDKDCKRENYVARSKNEALLIVKSIFDRQLEIKND